MAWRSTRPLKIRLLLLFLSLMGASVHYRIQVRYDHLKQLRLLHHQEVVSGLITPPYRYRVLTPYVGEIIWRGTLSFMGQDEASRMRCFVAVYFGLAFASFAVVYHCLFHYLRQWFDPIQAVLGCFMLFAVIPLSITGHFVDGDFVTLALVSLGLWCCVSGREKVIPLLVLVGAFNRVQILFLPALWLAHRCGSGGRIDRAALKILALSALAFAGPYVGLRLWLGDPGSDFTVSYHVARNWAHLTSKTLYAWLPNVVVFLLLALSSWRVCPRPLQYSFACLPVYLAVFFMKGNLWELAKALPMYLVLIPMSLIALFGAPPAPELPLIQQRTPDRMPKAS